MFFLCLVVFLAGCTSASETSTNDDLNIDSAVGLVDETNVYDNLPIVDTTKTSSDVDTTQIDVVDEAKVYLNNNINECNNIYFNCGVGKEQFKDENGCGCKNKIQTQTQEIKLVVGNKEYIHTNGEECKNFFLDCGDGKNQFKDESGCGCMIVDDNGIATDSVSADDSGKRYILKDLGECNNALFQCKANEKQFKDDLGCGCVLIQ